MRSMASGSLPLVQKVQKLINEHQESSPVTLRVNWTLDWKTYEQNEF
jgi:hypothetical protein